MADAMRLKRPLLYLLVGSVLVAIVLGISLVLRDTWGWFEVRVILSTITIAAASVCGMASDLSRARLGRNILPTAGMILALAAAALILYAMWTDTNSKVVWKTAATVSVFAVATAHACLISVARLARRFRWVLAVAYQVILGLALLIVVMMIWEIDEPRMFRAVAALAILDAGVTLLIPILHRISRTDPTTVVAHSLFDENSLATIDAEIAQLKKRLTELERLRAGIAGAA